jgi:predicted dehydrogenase
VASLHASWTQWKNRFDFEVYGEDGFVQVSGLGGSYGEEELFLGRRDPRGGPPETKSISLATSGAAKLRDDVWALEWQAFMNAVLGVDTPTSDISVVSPAKAIDAWQVLRIAEAAYEASRTGVMVTLQHSERGISDSSARKTLAIAGRHQENHDPF